MHTTPKATFSAFLAALALGATSTVAQASTDQVDVRHELRGPSVLDVAIEVNREGSPYAGEFNTLVALLRAVDPAVVAALTGNGQHTIFAPTDAAFEALGLTADNIGSFDTAALTNVLLYHMAEGRRGAADVVDATRIQTLGGGALYPSPNGTLTDENGRMGSLVVTNVAASNGVIHIIDSVLLP